MKEPRFSALLRGILVVLRSSAMSRSEHHSDSRTTCESCEANGRRPCSKRKRSRHYSLCLQAMLSTDLPAAPAEGEDES